MSLRALLYADLARQYEIEGRPGLRPNALRFLLRLLHFRYLPNVLCRVGRSSFLAGVPVLPQLCTFLNIVLFGLEVTPKCEIGPGVFFAHSVGTVVGAGTVGSNVTFYQGVTLGAKSLTMKFDPSERPVIGSNVLLGAGCKVLGPVEVGNGATVGANSLVIRSVPAGATVLGVPAKVIFHSAHSSSA